MTRISILILILLAFILGILIVIGGRTHFLWFAYQKPRGVIINDKVTIECVGTQPGLPATVIASTSLLVTSTVISRYECNLK